MKKLTFCAALGALISAQPAAAQNSEEKPHPSPNEIVAQADAEEWIDIAAEDLLMMRLADDRDGNPRQVIIQLMPEPFSQGWIRNIRKLAEANWWDGTSINRVQDNYVVQWGDPAEEESERKPLPEDLEVVPESEYVREVSPPKRNKAADVLGDMVPELKGKLLDKIFRDGDRNDPYAPVTRHFLGWPNALDPGSGEGWPVHCYGMVGVGRGMSPNTGSGADLYTVIGHAPRHLDRNIALVGRVISGIEHLSSLPRGTGPLGFYEEAEQRVPIESVRLASDLPAEQQPRFQYLDTDSDTFARYADARANRRDPFFIKPAGGADICNIPVPIRRVDGE